MNKEFVATLQLMADYLELNEDNVFRIRAFRRATHTLESVDLDLRTVSDKELLELPGIGKGILDLLKEFKATGKLTELEKLKSKFPSDLVQIMKVNSMGPTRTRILYKELKIDSLKKLVEAARSSKIAILKGFGEKIQSNILKNISYHEETHERLLIAEARSEGEELLKNLAGSSHMKDLALTGSLRRWKETIGDLDVLCTSVNPHKAISDFLELSRPADILAQGTTKASVRLKSGLQCDFRVVDKSALGAALIYFTGSKEHNIRLRSIAQEKGFKLNEYGLFPLKGKKDGKPVASRTEEEVYQKLGLPWIPPELREDRGEIEAGQKNELPHLVEENDIKGDFHNHTTLSDGHNSMEEMVQAAIKKNWSWYFCGDHSRSLSVAKGLSNEELLVKTNSLRNLSKRTKDIYLGLSSEVDILADGKLDYPPMILKNIDCVVASVHTRFNQTEKEMTERIVRAIESGFVHILGHPTGRRIGKRPAYPVNMDLVFTAAKKTGVAIEVNGQPERQELTDGSIKNAIQQGIRLALDTDAHSTSQLSHMSIAVHIARRGWAESRHIINTYSTERILDWLKSKS